MATPENTLWDKAALAIVQGPEARFAITVGGVTLELGDSGVRDLTGIAQNMVSGSIKAHRANGATAIVANALVKTTPGNTLLIPASGPMSAFAAGITLWTPRDQNGARLGIASSGSLYLDSTTPATPFYGTLTFPSTRGWWTALNPRPGVADGSAVGV